MIEGHVRSIGHDGTFTTERPASLSEVRTAIAQSQGHDVTNIDDPTESQRQGLARKLARRKALRPPSRGGRKHHDPGFKRG